MRACECMCACSLTTFVTLLTQVKDRLKMHKRKKEQASAGSDIAQRLAQYEAEQKRKKKRRKENRRRRKNGEDVRSVR